MQPLYHETNCQGVEKKADRIGRHDFRRCGKTRWRACFGKGTSSLVPISHLILSFRGGFSRRGICFSEFLRSLFSPCHQLLKTVGASATEIRKLGAIEFFSVANSASD